MKLLNYITILYENLKFQAVQYKFVNIKKTMKVKKIVKKAPSKTLTGV